MVSLNMTPVLVLIAVCYAATMVESIPAPEYGTDPAQVNRRPLTRPYPPPAQPTGAASTVDTKLTIRPLGVLPAPPRHRRETQQYRPGFLPGHNHGPPPPAYRPGFLPGQTQYPGGERPGFLPGQTQYPGGQRPGFLPGQTQYPGGQRPGFLPGQTQYPGAQRPGFLPGQTLGAMAGR